MTLDEVLVEEGRLFVLVWLDLIAPLEFTDPTFETFSKISESV
jgi:hypothetical protein